MSEQPAAGLTAEALRAAMEKVRDAPLRVCGITEPHVVHPEARGWTNCANCFGVVFVCIQASGCDGTSHDIRCNDLQYNPLEAVRAAFRDDHEPCCTSCEGKGGDASGPCWDCRGTGHAHP